MFWLWNLVNRSKDSLWPCAIGQWCNSFEFHFYVFNILVENWKLWGSLTIKTCCKIRFPPKHTQTLRAFTRCVRFSPIYSWFDSVFGDTSNLNCFAFKTGNNIHRLFFYFFDFSIFHSECVVCWVVTAFLVCKFQQQESVFFFLFSYSTEQHGSVVGSSQPPKPTWLWFILIVK